MVGSPRPFASLVRGEGYRVRAPSTGVHELSVMNGMSLRPPRAWREGPAAGRRFFNGYSVDHAASDSCDDGPRCRGRAMYDGTMLMESCMLGSLFVLFCNRVPGSLGP